MANLTQREIEARIKAFEEEMEKIKRHRKPVSKAEFILSGMSIAQKGKHLEVLNARKDGVVSQDISIKASNGGSKETERQDEGIEM